MSDRASSRTSSHASSLRAGFTKPRSNVPAVVGGLTYLVGLADIATGMSPSWRHRLNPVADLLPGAIGAAAAATVVSGILLAHGGPDGMSLDLMRRDRTAEAGVNELLIVDALRSCPLLGVNRVSLNFAAFRSTIERGERLGAGPVLRAWRTVLLFASRRFQIESLYRFNAKFQPTWVPRFVVYPATRDMPRIAVAASQAEAFLTWPRLRWFSGA